ncbi:right-handed parallel beta-helix repeat-containing protein [Bradyrhizobium genosp. L]|uniref:right-handed parallel beta-helix repeat-containing protein n=1 Tax=Bradyrhizobium genosp. L TaxID=83637 RepID=UPI0018A2CFF5|nr:right-handed parallel beta-helix repeat-containing protein [Bradyrhizobium genosp. L]QPF86072.1 right-handed parallel beta-helix repeat-containing protein [Bradyrhizobium genosp. L]
MFSRFAFLAALLAIMLAHSPASAQSTTVYVASNGNDQNNSCGLAYQPCATISRALGYVSPGGLVLCLSPPQASNSLYVLTAVTIDCRASVNGQIQINVPAGDTRQVVRLRHLTVDGLGGVGPLVMINTSRSVVLEDVTLVEGTGQGVSDQRSSAGKLVIKDSLIHKNAGPGIVVAGPAGNVAILDNVTSIENSYGLAVGSGNSVTVTRSTISENSTTGIQGDGGSQIVVDSSTISNNGTGVASASSVRLFNNTISFNGIAISGSTGSFGGNRLSGNSSAGMPLTPLGSASSEFAQQ